VANRAHAATFSLRYGSGVWAKFDELGPLYIGLYIPTHRGFGILTNLSPTRLRIIADKANLREDKLGLNEWFNGYELGFGSGLCPNGSDPRLSGQIQPERRVRPIGRLGHAAGLLGRLGRALRWRESRPAGPTGGFRPTRLEIKENPFYFPIHFIICKLI
jgi:hypothetical protein